MGGSKKIFLYPPEKFLVFVWGGLKTETGILHEILTVFHGGSKKFLIPPQKIVSVCFGGGGLKN